VLGNVADAMSGLTIDVDGCGAGDRDPSVHATTGSVNAPVTDAKSWPLVGIDGGRTRYCRSIHRWVRARRAAVSIEWGK